MSSPVPWPDVGIHSIGFHETHFFYQAADIYCSALNWLRDMQFSGIRHMRARFMQITIILLATILILLLVILVFAQIRKYPVQIPEADEKLSGRSLDERVSICQYLGGKDAAVCCSFDSLVWRDPDAGDDWAYTNRTHSLLSKVFDIHDIHPQFRTSATFVARNRYGLDKNGDARWDPGVDHDNYRDVDVRYAPGHVRDWIIEVESLGWIDIEDHGLTHSPDGARNLDFGEFDPYRNPNATDIEWCRDQVKLIRSIFSEIGLDNSEITGFRGPCNRWTDPLIDALVENNFDYLMIKGGRHYLHRHLRRGGTSYYEHFTVFPEIYETERGTRILTLPSNAHPHDPDYERYYEYAIRSGGIISFFFHPEELFHRETFDAFDERLRHLESYDQDDSDGVIGDQLWWCTARELADYVNLRRKTMVTGVETREKALKIELTNDGNKTGEISLAINPGGDLIEADISCQEPARLTWTPDGLLILTTNLTPGNKVLNLVSDKSLILQDISSRVDEGRSSEIIEQWLTEGRQIRASNNLLLSSSIGLQFVGASMVLGFLKWRGLKTSLLILLLSLVIGLMLLAGWSLIEKLMWVTYEYTGVGPVQKYATYGLNLATTTDMKTGFSLPLAFIIAFPGFFVFLAYLVGNFLGRSRAK